MPPSDLAQRRKAAIAWLKAAKGSLDEIQDKLDGMNADLLSFLIAARKPKTQIEEAAGPGGRLRFANMRLSAATVPLGPSLHRRKQEEVEEEDLKQPEAFPRNMQVNIEPEGQLKDGHRA